ncbi:MAG: DUF6502 family protein [Bdellovibrionota bacterium]
MKTNAQLKLLAALLRPAVRFALRSGLHIQELLEAAKAAFVAVAEEELIRAGEKANISRLSAATGIHRRDIMRLTGSTEQTPKAASLVSRVLGQWLHDRRFLSPTGKPRALTVTGASAEFRKLVHAVSRDLNPGTVLFELERLGAAKRKGKNGERLELIAHAYVPRKDAQESYRLLARDLEQITSAVNENVTLQPETPHLHATTEFDNIRVDALPEIRKHLLWEGSKFHARMRKYLSRYDLDIAPANAAGGARVSLTAFSFVEKEESK